MRLIIILAVFIEGCTAIPKTNTVALDNADVLILSMLAQDHLKKTGGRTINLADLILKDTSLRISKNFEAVELVHEGGHIAVFYKFSKLRDSRTVMLNDKEKILMSKLRWKEKQMKNQYDGEIRIAYPEKFYHVLKIIVKRPADNVHEDK